MKYSYSMEPRPGSGDTTRYDSEEDRARDEKKHDNPHHPSGYDHERSKADADDRQAETEDD